MTYKIPVFCMALVACFFMPSDVAFAQVPCDGMDSEAPVISGSPVLGNTNCVYPQPSASVVDNTDANPLVSVNGTVNYIETCNLNLSNWGTNACDYTHQAAMMLFNVPSTYKYYSVDSGSFLTMTDGSVHVTATLRCVEHPNGIFTADFWLVNPLNWTAWNALPNAGDQPGVSHRDYKADCNGTPSQHTNWLYYEIQSGGTLAGSGDFAGSNYTFSHSPTNHHFGYQLGNGANNYSPDYGSGGWFVANGSLIDNGVTISTWGVPGDFMFKHICEMVPEMQYMYNATDACGNSSQFTQDVAVCANAGPLLLNMPLAGSSMSICQLAEWQPEWNSNCSGAVTDIVNYSVSNSGDGTLQSVIVEVTGTDACNHTLVFSFEVNVTTLAQIDCIPNPCSGDFDQNLVIGTGDMQLFMGAFHTNEAQYDLNGDVEVDLLDLILLLQYFGEHCE